MSTMLEVTGIELNHTMRQKTYCYSLLEVQSQKTLKSLATQSQHRISSTERTSTACILQTPLPVSRWKHSSTAATSHKEALEYIEDRAFAGCTSLIGEIGNDATDGVVFKPRDVFVLPEVYKHAALNVLKACLQWWCTNAPATTVRRELPFK